MSFSDWLRGGRSRGGGDGNNGGNNGSNSGGGNRANSELEFYEDTHDEHGNYIGRRSAGRQAINQPITEDGQKIYVAANVPTTGTKSFGNIVDYRPTTIEEVEALISFLKKGEPAIANLNKVAEEDAQRILDFLSGAIFALGGNIHRIHDNIFLLSPAGVEIQSYYKNAGK